MDACARMKSSVFVSDQKKTCCKEREVNLRQNRSCSPKAFVDPSLGVRCNVREVMVSAEARKRGGKQSLQKLKYGLSASADKRRDDRSSRGWSSNEAG